MIGALFWLVIGVLFLLSGILWWEERKVRRGGQTLVNEITAYLSKRRSQ